MAAIEPNSPTAWVARSEVGVKTTYFTGNLADVPGGSEARRRAGEWLTLSEKGLVILSQKRLGPGLYEYRAMRTATPMSAARRISVAIAKGRRVVDRLIGDAL